MLAYNFRTAGFLDVDSQEIALNAIVNSKIHQAQGRPERATSSYYLFIEKHDAKPHRVTL